MNGEAWLISHLSSKLGIPAFAEVPADRPSRFVTVERVGGPWDPFRDRPMMAVQCWAESRYGASELARSAAAACADFEAEPGISRVSVGDAYDFPDPDSKQARYQLTVELTTS